MNVFLSTLPSVIVYGFSVALSLSAATPRQLVKLIPWIAGTAAAALLVFLAVTGKLYAVLGFVPLGPCRAYACVQDAPAEAYLLDRDIMHVPLEEILNTKVLATVVDGQVAYGSF